MKRKGQLFRLGVFADELVGCKTIEFLLKNYPNDLACVVVNNKTSNVVTVLERFAYPADFILTAEEILSEYGKEKLCTLGLNMILLAWWPYIIKEDIINIPKQGVINFHPSYLPHNAGKHPNFWSIVEERPAGVTIHFVDEYIDSGDIIFQKEISYSWEDTGETLYAKTRKAMVDLFEEAYPFIRKNEYSRRSQDKLAGSFHYGTDLAKIVKLNLDDKRSVRYILNLLRAKTFPPYEGCWFEDNGEKFEVRVSITRKEPYDEKDDITKNLPAYSMHASS